MTAARALSRENPLDTELDASAPAQGNTLTMDDLRDVPSQVTAELGQCDIYVRDILMLERGSVLALNKNAGEMADVLVNGVAIARGEIVVLGDSLNVRIAEIFGLTEKEPVEP